ncbi:MAG: hypothetical protein IJX02_03345 [Clostridia bacterium]|nr:hypothetical protein [Clostridia bacterium]
MKRFLAIALVLLMLLLPVLLASCDQEGVDNTMSGLMDTAKDIFRPFMEKTSSSVDDGTVDSQPSGHIPTPQGGNTNPDIQ